MFMSVHYIQGRAACEASVPAADNPYSLHRRTQAHREWRRGWFDEFDTGRQHWKPKRERKV